MAINPDALGFETAEAQSSWTSTDSLLYALGVGAGAADPTGAELEFTTENSHGVEQLALPTMCVVLGTASGAESPLASLGSPNYALMLHGGQQVILHKPLPVAATITATSKIAEIWDKGKAAVVVMEINATDASGDPLFTNRATLFFRGEGGWGGDSGPKADTTPLDGPADHIVSLPTRTDQALLYRLNGDRNPLHSDPTFAAGAGFDKPILHGLCTYGMSGRGLLHAVCDGDPARFKAMEGRFKSPVVPGEQLDLHIWSGAGSTRFRTLVGDRVVLDDGVLIHS